jgi:DNA-binding transcriptional regulator YdaS (Cro superfamily)
MPDIHKLIRDTGLKKQWIARQIGVDPGYFSQMLSGRAPFPDEKIASLAELLRCPVKDVEAAIADI